MVNRLEEQEMASALDVLVEYMHTRRCVINPIMNDLCTSSTDKICRCPLIWGMLEHHFQGKRTSDYIPPTTKKEKQYLIGSSHFEDRIPRLGILVWLVYWVTKKAVRLWYKSLPKWPIWQVQVSVLDIKTV